MAAGGGSGRSEPAITTTDHNTDVPVHLQKDEMSLGEVRGTKMKYDIGCYVHCLSSWDNVYHLAEIMDQRESKDGTEYYVHYNDQNKRLDEWVSFTRLEDPKTEIGCGFQSEIGENPAPLIAPATPTIVGSSLGDPKLDAPGTSDRKLTRNLKRRYDEIHNVQKGLEELSPIDQNLEKEHEEKTKVKNIQVVELGKYEIDTWYYSPYPEEYSNVDKLYICEFCLKYMKKRITYKRHMMKCCYRHPPGNEIYRTVVAEQSSVPSDNKQNGESTSGQSKLSEKGGSLQTLSVFEVDGQKSKLYGQNLCLLAKLFLDHKTLYYDVDSFLFYILTELDNYGHQIVGYFSKEKYSVESYNLACILTLPPFQRKGYGRFLITLAYELSKKEGKIGTPERPLSDLGQVSFRSYWSRVLLEVLRDHGGNLSIKDLSSMTAIRSDDIINTLQSLNLIRYYKGQHIISISAKVIEEHMKSTSKTKWSIDPSKLHWTPLSNPLTRRTR